MFSKEGVLKKFANSEESTCIGVLFFNEVVSLGLLLYLLKQRFQQGCFPVNVTKFLRAAFFTPPVAASVINLSLKMHSHV